MKKEKKYMVLVDYKNTIQGELSLVAHNLTINEASNMRADLIVKQERGEIDEDYLIENPSQKGIVIVEYTDMIWGQ